MEGIFEFRTGVALVSRRNRAHHANPWRSICSRGNYLMESVSDAKWRYVGFRSNLRQRLMDHNNGKLPNTARYHPWRIVMYASFASKKQALAFERYLKSGSGHAFARKRLWPA